MFDQRDKSLKSSSFGLEAIIVTFSVNLPMVFIYQINSKISLVFSENAIYFLILTSIY